MRWFLALAVLLGLIVAGAFEWEHAKYTAAGRSQQDTTVIIKPGTGLRGITEELAGAGVIGYADVFFWGVRLRQTNAILKAGEGRGPAGAGGAGGGARGAAGGTAGL